MRCPFCGEETTKVVDSRPSEDGKEIRRRRSCEGCGRRFTTYEKIETFPLMVVKKDNTREPYDRSKMEAGVMRACHKRPIPMQDIQKLLDDVENEIFRRAETEIPSAQIGELIMEHLKDLEEVAYVRFASVYREFTDVNTFAEELKKLLKKKKTTTAKEKKGNEEA
ncbi:MAG: transcriptional repressor NrdR [Lachnospiraceae bacterium]|nr:transcriptional repressor NrdR [Lachnospiraceae bacterium]